MSGRACSTANCQRPAKRVDCCCPGGVRLCDACRDTHACPSLLTVDRKKWLAEHAPEEELTTLVIEALNLLPGITARRTKRKQGPRAKSELDGVLDISGIAAPDGRAFYVETKKSHKDGCACASCVDQRDFAARVNGAGGVAVFGARTVREAVDGVRMGLARVRGGQRGEAA